MLIGSEVMTVSYPVVEAWKSVPYIETIMSARDIGEVSTAVSLLIREQPEGTVDGTAEDRLLRACTLIRSREAYERDGIDERSLDMQAKTLRAGRTMGDQWRDEGIKLGRDEGIKLGADEVLQRLMKSFGITMEPAIALTNGDASVLNKLGIKKMSVE